MIWQAEDAGGIKRKTAEGKFEDPSFSGRCGSRKKKREVRNGIEQALFEERGKKDVVLYEETGRGRRITNG